MGCLDSHSIFDASPKKLARGSPARGVLSPYRPVTDRFSVQNSTARIMCINVVLCVCVCGCTLQQNNRTIEKWNKFFFEKNISFGKKMFEKKFFFQKFYKVRPIWVWPMEQWNNRTIEFFFSKIFFF